ncbi:MAG: serine hydrolase domain-containing protein [Pirellulales bacterium]
MFRVAVGLLVCATIAFELEALRAEANPAAAPTAEEASAAGTASIGRLQLEAFVDEFFAAHMGPLHVPGASFALVQDGKLVLAKGFGFSNLEKRTPVVAERTLFDVQSVTKLFTITAVMQAAERGIVRLDDDVNRHLKTIQLEETFPEPVRLFHLMTHTSGLEDQGVGITARQESDVLPLGEFLAKSLPSRIRPPGRVMLYSDCGICLAGYVVESATGVPLAQFMEENILKPLGMQRTHFLKLPPELELDLAVGYSYEHGEYKALPHYYYNIWASSSMMTTATDMAHFMITHLQDGRYEGMRILNEESAREMHRRQFTHHPGLPGVCFDFFERFQNQQRAIGHTGAGSGFVSELLLIPEHNVGYFLAVNSAEGELLNAFRDSFFDRYFPIQLVSIEPWLPEQSRTALGELTGWYWFNRYDRRRSQKIDSLVNGYVHASANADGSLSVDGHDYVEIEPLLFRDSGGDDRQRVAFGKNDGGQAAYLFAEGNAYDRVPWFNAPPFHLGLLAVVVLVFLSACLVWPSEFLIRRWRRRELPPQPMLARLAWLWTCATCAVNLFAILMVILTLSRVTQPSVATEFQTGLPQALKAIIAVATMFAALSLAVPAFAVLVWIRHYWSFSARMYFSLLAMACLAYVWFCNFWNLIGFRG